MEENNENIIDKHTSEENEEEKDENITANNANEEEKDENIITNNTNEEEKNENIITNNKNEEEKEVKKEIQKIITSLEYKKGLQEEPNNNVIYSEDNNNIIFISLELLISLINDSNLEKTNKNINYSEILLYLVYQKNALMTNEIFFDIINSYMKSNNINTGLLLLNSYLINYYSSEIIKSNDIMNKVINLYKMSKKQEITFKLVYDEDKKININNLIEYIKTGKKDLIDSLGGMESIRTKEEQKETIIPEVTDRIFDVFCWDPIEIARQITLITQYLYRNIGCQELILGGWTKNDKMEKCPNVSRLIIRFNKISKWIMEEILSYDFSKDRAKVMEVFIAVAEELKNLNNLNDCFAVVTTFNHLCMKNLKKSWEQVSENAKNKQKDLSDICSILKNFEKIKNEFLEYKKNVKNINELQEGCIPYLAPYLKDLAFLEEGQKYFNQNKLINIHKIIIVGKIIKNIKESQMFVYSYKPVYSLSILSDPEPLDDEDLTSLSESIEPKFRIGKKSKIKRKTHSETILENNKSGIPQLFLEYLKDYGYTMSKKMTLKERIKLFQRQYLPVSLVGSSNPVTRSLYSYISFDDNDSLRSSSKSMNRLEDIITS
jgi:hypothetical protein